MGHKLTARVAGLRRHRVRMRTYRPGAPPGSLETSSAGADANSAPAQISLLRYQEGADVLEQADIALADCTAPAADAADVTWLHLQGAPTSDQLRALGDIFDLHPLALEDIYHRESRAKLEVFGSQQFVVLNQVHRDGESRVGADQVAFFLGQHYLISINEGPEDIFEPVRQRIRGQGRIRANGADYLLYALIDTVIDSGFPLLEELGDELETLEDEILEDPNRQSRNKIHYAKRELVMMRRAWWPQREVVAALMRDDDHFLSDNTRLYMRDCYDHCVIAIDFVETYREMASSLLDTYLSAVSQRMNDIMKALTIIATIFLPLTFLTGLYGMNFDTGHHWNMPELHWRFGYFYALGVMAAVVVGMLVYFKRKRWW
jgi:magnesium transporter